MAAKVRKRPGKLTYAVTIIINAVLIYVFNNLLNWGVPFLTSDYSGIIWAFDLSFGASILINLTYLLYDEAWYRHLSQVVLNIITLFVIYLILVVFPFTFAEESWAFWLKLAIVLVMAGIGIASIVELVSFVLRRE